MSASTILLVDDDEVLSQVLRRVLNREGYTVVEAGNVAQALELARQHNPQLGLFDLCLPDGDGVELARKLEEQHGTFPLILITAYPLRLREHPELAQKFTRVLTKPLNLEELRQAIETSLAHPAPPLNLDPKTALPILSQELSVAAPPAHAPTPAAPAITSPPTSPQAPPAKHSWLLTAVGVAIAAVGLFLALPALGVPGIPNVLAAFEHHPTKAAPSARKPQARLVAGDDDSLELPTDVAATLGLDAKGVMVVADKAQPRQLELAGTLAFNPNRLGGIQSRFAGEVIEIAKVKEPYFDPATGRTEPERPLTYGDRVEKGDLLAVIYSKELGEKKSELVSTLLQLYLDERNLKAQLKLEADGAGNPAQIRMAENAVSKDRNEVSRVQQTLSTWKVPPAVVRELEEEAKRINALQGVRDEEAKRKAKQWPRVEVRAPFDGTVVEKNLNLGRMVDATFDLYKIADLSKMAAYMNAYEEDVKVLRDLPRPIPWAVRVTTPHDRVLASEGAERVSYVIDPSQHTAMVMGLVDSPQRDLASGQFATATIQLPAPAGVVSIPPAALVEDGSTAVVFVQRDPERPVFTQRRVAVVKRFQDMIYVRSELTAGQKKQGLQPVRPGDRLVIQAAVELKSDLDDLLAQKKAVAEKAKGEAGK